jgi:hypothetical protein
MATATKTKVKWSIEGDYLQGCNCDYGCPCEFEAPPTKGFCDGVGAWRIKKGSFGKVKLDGLTFGFIAHWPAEIHKGNGTIQLVLDEKAKPEQRAAIGQIASGAAGGMPFEILIQTFAKVLEPLFAPVTFESKGRNSRVRLGDYISIGMEPIKNPVTGEPEELQINHGTGFLFKGAEVVSARECVGKSPELNFSYPNKAGFVAKFKYGN